jgi:hypothetical protein
MPETRLPRYRDAASLAFVAAQAKSYAVGAVHFIHVAEGYERACYVNLIDKAFYQRRAIDLRRRAEEEAHIAISIARGAASDLSPY